MARKLEQAFTVILALYVLQKPYTYFSHMPAMKGLEYTVQIRVLHTVYTFAPRTNVSYEFLLGEN